MFRRTLQLLAMIAPAFMGCFVVLSIIFAVQLWIQTRNTLLEIQKDQRDIKAAIESRPRTIDGYTTVGGAASELHVDPFVISQAIYDKRIDTTVCRKVSGRWWIPRDYLPRVREVLVEQGKLKP